MKTAKFFNEDRDDRNRILSPPYFMVKGRCSYQLLVFTVLGGTSCAIRRNINRPLVITLLKACFRFEI
jgi:hypothetical protein